jgi:membrane-associated protease RseP (regulator of RpoE activity)
MNEEDTKKASLRQKMSIYSAGISINFITAIIAFVVFALLMLAPLGNVDGVRDDGVGVYVVTSNSPAYIAGVPAGAVITEIDDVEVTLTEYGSEFILSDEDIYSNTTHKVTYLTGDGIEYSKNILLGLYVNAVINGSPADLGGLPNDVTITEITNTDTTITTPITGLKSFRDYISESRPGDVVTISYIENGVDATTGSTTLTANGDVGYIGVNISYSGMIFITPEYIMGTAINPMYGQTTLTGSIVNSLSYPFMSMSGFSPIPEHCQWWFDAPGGEIFWMLAALIYWMFWINLLLGITNALPAIPFDGGFLFKGWVTQLLNKLDYKDQETRDKMADNVTNAVSGFMLFLLILVVLAVIL